MHLASLEKVVYFFFFLQDIEKWPVTKFFFDPELNDFVLCTKWGVDVRALK